MTSACPSWVKLVSRITAIHSALLRRSSKIIIKHFQYHRKKLDFNPKFFLYWSDVSKHLFHIMMKDWKNQLKCTKYLFQHWLSGFSPLWICQYCAFAYVVLLLLQSEQNDQHFASDSESPTFYHAFVSWSEIYAFSHISWWDIEDASQKLHWPFAQPFSKFLVYLLDNSAQRYSTKLYYYIFERIKWMFQANIPVYSSR